MLRNMVLGAVTAATAAAGALSLTPTPAAAWYYNQPYIRPCRCHPWLYGSHVHHYVAYHPRHYAYVTYHHPHHAYAYYWRHSHGPLVDCI